MTDLKTISKIEGLLLFLSSALLILILFCPYSPSIIATTGSGNLIPVVHSDYNSYFHLTSLGYWLSTRVGSGILLVMGLMGLTALLGTYNNSLIASLALSTICYGLLVSFFGFDFIILAPLCALPWLCLTISSANAPQLSFLVLLSTIIFNLWLLLYSLSAPLLLLAIVIHFVIERKSLEPTISVVLLIGIVALFTLTLLSPTLPWPDYPWSARITSMLDGPPWIARPLVGEDLPFSSIDRNTLISQYHYLLLPLAFLTLIAGLLVRNSPLGKRAWLGCAALLAVVYLDFRLPEEFAQIAPLQSLPRLFPELSLIPLAPLCFAIVLGSLVLILGLTLLRSHFTILVGLLVTSSVLIFNLNRSEAVPSDQTPQIWTASPSRFVAAFFTNSVLENAKSDWRKFKPKSQYIKVSSSDSQVVDAKLILDKDQKTRWSPASGKQSGSEWLMIEFTQSQKLIGIELQTGIYDTDFPRGLRIFSGLECNPTSLEKVADYKAWQGQAEFTQKGYPYFSAQSEVRVFLPKEIETKCLRVEQTGKTNNFDWSVAEFRLIQKKESVANLAGDLDSN